MTRKDITSLRGTLDFLQREGEVIHVEKEVDPVYEIAGILKALEGGPAVIFDRIKGYPGARNVGNMFARMDRISKIFGVDDEKKLKFKFLESMKTPIPSVTVSQAPCQEVVLDKDVNVQATLPVIKHTTGDAGHIIGGGVQLVDERYFRGGTHLSFNRIFFRAPNWATIMAGPPTHLGVCLWVEHRRERVPVTINIGTPPAVSMIAGGGNIHMVIPTGSDELGMAGALQGAPVEIVKAKTVDTCCIAQSEWVIEGYFDPEVAWETEEAERIGKGGEAAFFPEWTGYMGRAFRFRKFQATAITHRRDNPIFFTPLAHSYEGENLIIALREACFYEVADRVMPGLVTDVHILHGLTVNGGVVFQVRKRRDWDEGYQRNILSAALGASPGLRLAIAVDEDVDIYNADDVLWALVTRVNPNTDILRGPTGGRGMLMQPMERRGGGLGGFEGGMGIDATIAFEERPQFERAKYPVDKVDLKKYFSPEELARALHSQDEYARVLAKRGW
ncbi:MAG: UbiD family decarboxylase [Chloroflexi bacterium]|nr:UbiD family decarboxylase [Chloroflexota bacterium]